MKTSDQLPCNLDNLLAYTSNPLSEPSYQLLPVAFYFRLLITFCQLPFTLDSISFCQLPSALDSLLAFTCYPLSQIAYQLLPVPSCSISLQDFSINLLYCWTDAKILLAAAILSNQVVKIIKLFLKTACFQFLKMSSEYILHMI